MVFCSILECKNDSRSSNKGNAGISYFTFPKDGNVKEKWIEATGRVNWWPTKTSKICSVHFLESDFIIKNKGQRHLKPKIFPTLRIVKVYNEPQNNTWTIATSSKRKADSNDTDIAGQPKEKIQKTVCVIDQQLKSLNDGNNDCNSECSTPRKRKLKGQLRFCKNKLTKQHLKIKNLQAKNRRLKKKVENVQEILTKLEEKFGMSKENLDCLKNTNVEIRDLLARQAQSADSNVISKAKYSPALRSFALTLHFYSPKAYNYVRKTFKTSLPHTRTLKKWYSKVGGEPGFTAESLSALKHKAQTTEKPILATLIIDEMSIRRRIEWDGRKFHGYVDMGTGIDGDHLPEAKEALVFLVNAINSHFKVPVGFFLVDGVTGEKRADLVKQCLELIHDTGIKIVAVTFDGCAANISMSNHLGCSLEEQKITFDHPITNDPVVAILDPCHMIKLLRNALENFQILVDCDGNEIRWQHFVELNKLQNDETLHLANKLRDRHINFQNERMKVKLATQLFSTSVAETLKYCRETGLENFVDSKPTENFVIICNNLFDIFNSRNLYFYGYKKALHEYNSKKVFEFLSKASEYIKHLKLVNGTLVIETRRKTGFLGFLGCIKALEILCTTLIQTKILIYLPFYKLSQDHIELFFCNIRGQGGSNNNPTARQFVSAYKKILVHVQLQDFNTGNCVALEQISILNCSSAVERINSTTSTGRDTSLYEIDDESEIEELGGYFTDFSNQAISYISGYIVRSLIRNLHCDICANALVTHHFMPLHKFITAKDQGGLLYPSPDVIKICQTAETFLRSVDIKAFQKEVTITLIMRKFIGTLLFNDIASHQVGGFPASNHITDLMKAIVEKYVNVRLHHLLKLKIKLSKRQFLNKYVLFQGQ